MQPVTTLKTDRREWTPDVLLGYWHQHLLSHDHSRGTVKKYTQAISHFLSWYEQEECVPLQLAKLTPIALIGYRNELQHEQHKSISTINVRLSALLAWCVWMVDQGYLAGDPAARVKLISEQQTSKREGLSNVQVLLQTGIRLSECSGLTFGDITFGERSGMLLVRAGHDAINQQSTHCL